MSKKTAVPAIAPKKTAAVKIYFPAKDVEQGERVAKQMGISFDDLVIRAVERWVAKRKAEKAPPKIPVTIELPQEVALWMDRQAKKLGLSFSEFAERALNLDRKGGAL